MLVALLASVAGTLGAYALYKISKLVYRELTSPIKHLPGPKSSHFFYGNLKEIFKAENSVLHEQWVQEYGSTLKYKGLLGATLNHFLTNSNIYQKPEASRSNIARMFGPGATFSGPRFHHYLLPSSFGAPQVRELTSIFVDKSLELRDIWASQVSNAGGTARLDVLSWLSKATLDIIGLAGFNYHFNSLTGSETASELGGAFSAMFQAGMQMTPLRILQAWSPAFRIIPTEIDTIIGASRATMTRIGRKLLQDSKNEMAENGTFEKGRARDLLSLLVHANTDKGIPESQRLSDEDVLAQVPTFLIAGHETTSTATTWALYALTQNMAAQTRLREELLKVETDHPTMDQLNELPYLDCVVRETLRIHAPVPSTIRTATQDDVVPLATPFTDVNGIVHETLKVNKGQTIMIPILAMNRDRAIWGPDAMEFLPERWESQTISNSIPGVWGHMLTFLGGPRACIGYRFSLVETKALLFTLIRAFEFELAVPAEDLGKRSTIVQRPIVRSEPEKGNQMPLFVRRHVRS
ncbi:cytochrome P450 [Mycena latifolia]|nr:cytochrome P450 [Mycena latifolia]